MNSWIYEELCFFLQKLDFSYLIDQITNYKSIQFIYVIDKMLREMVFPLYYCNIFLYNYIRLEYGS